MVSLYLKRLVLSTPTHDIYSDTGGYRFTAIKSPLHSAVHAAAPNNCFTIASPLLHGDKIAVSRRCPCGSILASALAVPTCQSLNSMS
ncbi:MAG: hypothetical protein GXZ00_06355 [Synergistaceae bacterium]|nr:hypothetical protein [Synergistaceae bacterium]